MASGDFNEREAKGRLGGTAWDEIVNAASAGRINDHQMKDVAYALPTDRKKDLIGGDHKRRMQRGGSPNEMEMRNILSDWFKHGDMPEERAKVLEVLIKHFDEHGNKPLARDLTKIKDDPEQVLVC